MTQDNKGSFIRDWKEYWGRKRIIEPIPFTDTSILTQPVTFRIGYQGDFVQLPANTAGIIASSTGQKQVIVQGGFYELEEGAYTIQYVDLRERAFTFSNVTAPTINGSDVSLSVSVTYKINEPTQIVNISTPLQTLFSVFEGAIKNFISTHRHDELIGEKDNEKYISDYHIIHHIKEYVATNQACRAFWLIDVVIVERHGNVDITRLKHERLVQENQSIIQRENVIQQQGIADEEKILASKKVEQDRIKMEGKAQIEARQSEIMEEANRLRIELDNMRRDPDIQLRKIEALEKALEALTQAYIKSGFSRGLNEGGVLESFSRSLADVQNDLPQISPRRSKSVNELGSTIINLIAPEEKDT